MSADEHDEHENELTLKEMKLETKEIFDQIIWLCDMYSQIGESEAKGIKFVRVDEVNWDRPLLNKRRHEILKNSKMAIEGNYKTLQRKNHRRKVKRKMVPAEDGTVKTVFSNPILVSQEVVDFFNSVDLGMIEVNGKKVKVQKIISGLNSQKGKGIMTQNTIMNLFGMWIYHGTVKNEKGEVVQRGLKCKDQSGKILVDDNFVKYFGAYLEKVLQEKKNKRLPVKQDKTVIQGKTVVVPYSIPYPTFFTCLIFAHRTTLPNEKQDEMRLAMKEENDRLKTIYEWTKKNVKVD